MDFSHDRSNKHSKWCHDPISFISRGCEENDTYSTFGIGRVQALFIGISSAIGAASQPSLTSRASNDSNKSIFFLQWSMRSFHSEASQSATTSNSVLKSILALLPIRSVLQNSMLGAIGPSALPRGKTDMLCSRLTLCYDIHFAPLTRSLQQATI